MAYIIIGIMVLIVAAIFGFIVWQMVKISKGAKEAEARANAAAALAKVVAQQNEENAAEENVGE